MFAEYSESKAMIDRGLMMPRRLAALIGLTLIYSVVTAAQSGDPVPPPLAYANWNTIEQEYYILDFAAGEITTVPSEGDLYPEFGGEQFLPQEITLQSPHDAELQMHFIAEGESPESNLYTLYVVINSARTRLTDHAFPVTPLEWSPDGRYFYFEVYYRVEGSAVGNYILYYYDLHRRTVALGILEHIVLTSCSPSAEWCVVQRRNRTDTFNELELYLLNTNTGHLTLLAETASIGFYWVWWQMDASTFMYVEKLGDNLQAIRLYDYEQQIDTVIAEVEGLYVTQVIPSPDDRWLAVTTTTDLYLIDQTVENPAPVLLTGEIDFQVTIKYLRWMSDDRLFFDTRHDEERQYGYYTATVTDGIISATELSAIGELLDDDWSADGRWLALSFGDYGENNNAYVIDAFGQVPVYQLQVDFAPRDMICIDWYEPEQYQTDITSLCDIYMGIG
jgi:hypothetical protein